jgi:hypothetical protein
VAENYDILTLDYLGGGRDHFTYNDGTREFGLTNTLIVPTIKSDTVHSYVIDIPTHGYDGQGITFENGSTAVVNGLQVCWPNDTLGELDLSLHCNLFNGQSHPTGFQNLGAMQAGYLAITNNLNVGMPLPSSPWSATYTGSAGSTTHVYTVVLTGPTGADGPIQLTYPTGARYAASYTAQNVVATLDGSDYVTFTCPTYLQADAVAGSTYTVWADTGSSTARRLGTCPFNGTLVDDGTVTATTPINNTNDWNSDVGAARHYIAYGGGIGQVPSPGSVTPDSWFYRNAANSWCAGAALGGTCDGNISAATFNSKTPCNSDGSNCPTPTNIPYRYVGTVTAAAGTSDTLTVTGLTTSNHCTSQPTNAGAAALTGVYLTTGTGSLTLTHSTATGGETFDIACNLL